LVIDADNYLQFVEDGDNEYWLFDLHSTTPVISEEINGRGVEDFLNEFKGIDKLFEKFKHHTYDQWNRCIPDVTYLVIDIKYIPPSNNPEDVDWDIECRFVGYFDNQMKLNEVKLDFVK